MDGWSNNPHAAAIPEIETNPFLAECDRKPPARTAPIGKGTLHLRRPSAMLCGMTPSVLDNVGIIVVDHGSKLPEANEMLEQVARQFAKSTGVPIIEPAHMELAEPTIAQAFNRCVERGAAKIVVQLFFLSPGRHSSRDIPELVAEAAREHPRIPYVISEPMGMDPRVCDLMLARTLDALERPCQHDNQ